MSAVMPACLSATGLKWYAGLRFGLTSPAADVTTVFGAVLKF